MLKTDLRSLPYRLLGFALLVAGLSASACASVPELDPGSAAGAITLITCGLALFAGRRRRA